jgi:putative ABC transport system permease protein
MRMAYVVRTAGDPMRMAQAVRQAVAEVDAIHPAADFRTVESDLGAETQGLRAQMILFGVFGGLALVLASVGIYGVIAYSVAQRTREIGIRMALGAPAGGVLGLVAGQALGIVLVGLGVGLAGALALTRVLASTLWGVSATDPLTFAGAGTVLFLAALCACLVPARRAIRVDPTVALRASG